MTSLLIFRGADLLERYDYVADGYWHEWVAAEPEAGPTVPQPHVLDRAAEALQGGLCVVTDMLCVPCADSNNTANPFLWPAVAIVRYEEPFQDYDDQTVTYQAVCEWCRDTWGPNGEPAAEVGWLVGDLQRRDGWPNTTR